MCTQTLQFQEDLMAVKGNPTDLIPNGHYHTLSPIIMLHARKLWTGGFCANIEQLQNELINLDTRLNPKELTHFLQTSIRSKEWQEERVASLQRSYDEMHEDRKNIVEHIDHVYDNVFSRLRHITERSIDEISRPQIDEITGEEIHRPIPIASLRTLTTTAKDLHAAQREVRNISNTIKHEHSHQHSLETQPFDEQTAALDTLFKDAPIIIDAEQILDPKTPEDIKDLASLTKDETTHKLLEDTPPQEQMSPTGTDG